MEVITFMEEGKMNIQLYTNPNINGKIIEKRLTEVLNEHNLTDVEFNVCHEEFPQHDRILFSPTLVINDRVVSSGKMLSKEEIDMLLYNNCF